MTLQEAMALRHTVRKFTDKPIDDEAAAKLKQRIEDNNRQLGLKMQLVLNNDKLLPGLIKLIMAKGAANYIILDSEATPIGYENIGYAGADIMLYAQTLGLNTWWIGGTYSRDRVIRETSGENVSGLIVVGYGQTQGKPHKSKKISDVSLYNGAEIPQWFIDGVTAALLAPTAINRQAFMLVGNENKVSLTYKSGMLSDTDRGIVKYHFELGAGKENFEWTAQND